jgi:type I restriction enzyme, S subunit
MSVDIKFVSLTFINSDEEILKQIRNTVAFSFLSKEHEETSLEHYLESTQYGYTASASTVGTHRLVRITDINSGNVNWETVPFCDCDSESKYLLKDNDILVARTGGTTGKSFIVLDAPSNAIFASYLIRLRLKEQVNIDFINCFLNSYTFWSQIIEMKSGSAMPNVNAEKLKTLKLPKCDFKTQVKIVEALKSNNQSEYAHLFQKIEDIESVFNNGNEISVELNHQRTLLKQLRQQLLQDAVQGKLVENDENTVTPSRDEAEGIKGAETGSQLLQRIKKEKEQLIKDKKLKKEKDLPTIKAEDIPFEIPDNWVWCRLGEITNLITSGSRDWAQYYSSEGDVFLRMGNLSRDSFNLRMDKIQYVTPPKNQEGNRTRLEEGDILVSITGEVGNLGLIPKNFGEAYINQHTALVRLNNIIDIKFVCYLLLSDVMKEQFNAPQRGMKNSFRLSDIEYLLIPLPPLSIQQKIVEKVGELMGLCDAFEGSIEASVAQNEALLQQVLREALG